jgi:hypothetical protein
MSASRETASVLKDSMEMEERRRSPRKPHVAEALLSSPTGGTPIEVTSVDISRHGVALSIKAALATGTFHILKLGLGAQRIVTEVRILSCNLIDDGSYRIHAEFS